jgi:opacity protein-like surface antigen
MKCGAIRGVLPPRSILSLEEYRMTRRLFAVFAAALLAAAPSTLRAQSFSIAGGLSLPVSDFGDVEQSGYNGTIGLNFGAPLIPVGARIEGSINGFNHKNNLSGDTRVLSATANAIVGLGMPYLIGGVGYYNTRIKVGALSDDRSSGGFNIGAGLSFPLPALSPFVEIRYHQLLGDNDKVKFIPITFGIKF